MKSAKRWHHVFCHICPAHCARKVAVENGEIVQVLPDKESPYPSAPCRYNKSRIMKEVRSHPDRLKHPLKRVGPRGSGQWDRISWDQALDTIAERLNTYKQEFGADCVAFLLGEPKLLEFAFAQRFASTFGTANCVTPGNY